jgi:3-oxoacyl-[acyl-carrier-protein] synthase III
MTPLNQAKGVNHSAVQLMVQAVNKALADAEVEKSCVDGLIAMPSLMSDRHFMIGHAVASEVGFLTLVPLSPQGPMAAPLPTVCAGRAAS